MKQLSGKAGHAAAVLILILLPLIFFWQMIVLGEEPISGDSQAVKPLGRWALAAEEELGETPLWCPAVFAGMPSYGSFIYTPSNPLDVMRQLRLWFGQTRGMRYYLSLLVGGLALYLWLTWRRRPPLAALGGTLIYVMTPYFLGTIAAGHSTKLQALFLVPLVFLAIDLLLARRTLAAAGFLAAAVALELWNNHPQISYYAFFLGALYAIGVLIFDRPAAWKGRKLIWGLALGIIALLLAAGLVLEPYGSILEYTPHSIRGEGSILDGGGEAAQGAGWDYATAWSFHPEELICFLFPAWFGLKGGSYWGSLIFTQSTHYFGVTALLLGLVGLFLTKGVRRWLWLGLGFLVLLIGFGRHFPVLYGPMYHFLPMFDRFRVPSMVYALLPLFVGLLAADGISAMMGDRIAAPNTPAGKKKAQAVLAAPALMRYWMPVTVTLGVLLVLWVFLGGAIADQIRSSGGFVHAREASALGPHSDRILDALRTRPLDGLRTASPIPPALINLVTERMSMLRQTVTTGLLLLFLSALVIEARRRSKLGGFAAAFLLVALLGADLWIHDRKFYELHPKAIADSVLREDGVVRFLKAQEGPFRVAPLAQGPGNPNGFGTNRFAAFGIESVGGYQPAKLRAYDDLIRSGAIYSLPVLNMLGVRYVISDGNLEGAGLPLAYEDRPGGQDGSFVHLNPSAFPRAWFVEGLEHQESALSLLEGMQTAAFNPGAEAWIVENEHPDLPAAYSSGEVKRTNVGLHELQYEVTVSGPEPGLLVFGEIYYEPGWKASIDGEEAALLRVNHILRALQVPPGTHEVRMWAVSAAREAGARVSRVAALICLGLLASGWILPRLRGREAVVKGD